MRQHPASSRWKIGISTACYEKKNSWRKDFPLRNALLGGAPGCPADDLGCCLEVSTPGKGGPESHFDPSSNSLEHTSWSLAPRPSQRGSSVFIASCVSLSWRTNSSTWLIPSTNCTQFIAGVCQEKSLRPYGNKGANGYGCLVIDSYSPFP